MKAVGYWIKGLPISDPHALEDIEPAEPELGRAHAAPEETHIVGKITLSGF